MEYCEKCGYIKPQCQCEKPKTNADRIRNMTDEELAKFLLQVEESCEPCMYGDKECKYRHDFSKGCDVCFLEWLQAEVEEGE